MTAMYKVTFYALQDNERHEIYASERVVADICCRGEYHLISATFMYSYMKLAPEVPCVESVEQIEEIVRRCNI
jgi:hypothetical protein